MASSEARELSLIDKLELKIALAESSSSLQRLLNTFLPPLLLKLASEHVSVRNKVSEIASRPFLLCIYDLFPVSCLLLALAISVLLAKDVLLRPDKFIIGHRSLSARQYTH